MLRWDYCSPLWLLWASYIGLFVSTSVLKCLHSYHVLPFALGEMKPTTKASHYLTAPKSAPSHSFFSVSIVFSGSATPVCLNVSNPASRSTKESLSPREVGSASRIRLPAGITSRPMPSPGMRPANGQSCIAFWFVGSICTYSECFACHWI